MKRVTTKKSGRSSEEPLYVQRGVGVYTRAAILEAGLDPDKHFTRIPKRVRVRG